MNKINKQNRNRLIYTKNKLTAVRGDEISEGIEEKLTDAGIMLVITTAKGAGTSRRR